MADPRGFVTFARRVAPYRPVAERLSDHRDPATRAGEGLVREQASRCMGCGVPFCHSGCPLQNLVPDWSELVRTGRFEEASARLHETNNFPEFTGKLCPAPCEEACVLALNSDPVTIKQIELAIVERAFAEGWVRPRPAAAASGRAVAIVGSGPAGLAAAQQLARAGHAVTVFERDEEPGGLLRFGIPDFKLEKRLIDRRVDQLMAEGVRIEVGSSVGSAVSADALAARFDAVLLATGAQRQRTLDLPGARLRGVEPAMTYLTARNRHVAGASSGPAAITAAGKDVVVIGGGDTSADCLGCAVREGARSVTEVAHGPTPPLRRTPLQTWPEWPFLLRTYAAHEEGGVREWEVEPTAIAGADGAVRAVHGRRLADAGIATGDDVVFAADLVLVAIGFAGVEPDPVYQQLGVALQDGRVTAAAGGGTSVPGVFAAGDCVRGADLIVTAIAEGRAAAARIGARLGRRVAAPAA
ncbi:MAG TPA: glutamate synthase subunit beta [Gaiellales bacterium]